MAHQTDTLTQPIPMPRHTHLLPRNGRYYLNVKVPKDLRDAFKKELIRKSLNTSDRSEAVRRLRLEVLQLDAKFAEERERKRQQSAPPKQISALSKTDALQLVVSWLIKLEAQSDEWWNETGCNLAEHEADEVVENLRIEFTALNGGSAIYQADDASRYLDSFLQERRWLCDKDSEAYRKLLPLFRRARIENLRRDIRRLTGEPLPADRLFDTVSADTATPETTATTVGEMLDRFTDTLTKAKRTAGTLRTYSVPIRLLRESLGADRLVSSITERDIEELFDVLRRAPKNARQRYPTLTLRQAIAQAERDGDNQRLGGKVLANYFNNVSSIFKFAVRRKLISENPASDPYLRSAFSVGEQRDKPLFTIDQLNRLFQAPLYTGCEDDQSGYLKPGPNTPRRGRFWLPLIGLFHGLRSNEAAQLETADVKEENGILFVYVRRLRDEGMFEHKKTKTLQSKRRVPIHPELLRIGFAEFVETRRADATEPTLFPEIGRSAAGYASDLVGKWFSRFVRLWLGEDCRATFGSFRHHFRSALGEADIPIPLVEALGGWEGKASSAERNYLKLSLRRLRDGIAKVEYPGLHLRHLYRS